MLREETGNMWDNAERSLQRCLQIEGAHRAVGCPLDVPSGRDGPPKVLVLVVTMGGRSLKSFGGLNTVTFEDATAKGILRKHQDLRQDNYTCLKNAFFSFKHTLGVRSRSREAFLGTLGLEVLQGWELSVM